MSAQKLRHNHELLPFGAYVDEGECPRCDQLRTEKLEMGETPHNHRPQPFGRHVKGCPRCIELVSGAKPRESAAGRQARLDRELSEEMRRHFADPNSRCDHLTCFQW